MARGAPLRADPGRPALGNQPDIWLLGSSGYSAQVAGLLGLPFAFAHHFSAANTEPALQLYRDCFRPSERLAEPYALIGVAVVCADTAARARYLHGSSRLSMLRLRTGRPGQLPSPEEAAAYTYTPERSPHRRTASPGRMWSAIRESVADAARRPAGPDRRRRVDDHHQRVGPRRSGCTASSWWPSWPA